MVLKITNLHILRHLPTCWLYLLECYTFDNQLCTHTASANDKQFKEKWKPWLINRIREGYHRPMELQRTTPAATKRVLTQQLNELENMGVVYKKIYPVLPARVEYYLTDFGLSLLPIIDAMDKWGQSHSETVKTNFMQKE